MPLTHNIWEIRPGQNVICIWNYYVQSKNNGEKWSRKKYFLNFSMRKPFSSNSFYFIGMRSFVQNDKFSNKNDLPCAWRDFKKILTYGKWNFKPKISPIFHFDCVNHGQISHILCFKKKAHTSFVVKHKMRCIGN
jgi:hypothetical protein